MRIYAKTDYDGCEYITAGKLYEVKKDYGRIFAFDNEAFGIGGSIAAWNNCHHLDGHAWQRVEKNSDDQ